jgi:hypothetical protein
MVDAWDMRPSKSGLISAIAARSFTDSRSRHAERRCPAVRQVGKASLLPAIALAALSTAVSETAGRVFTHAQLADPRQTSSSDLTWITTM